MKKKKLNILTILVELIFLVVFLSIYANPQPIIEYKEGAMTVLKQLPPEFVLKYVPTYDTDSERWSDAIKVQYGREVFKLIPKEEKILPIELENPSTILLKIYFLSEGVKTDTFSVQLYDSELQKLIWEKNARRHEEYLGLVKDYINITKEMFVNQKKWAIKLTNGSSKDAAAIVLIGTFLLKETP